MTQISPRRRRGKRGCRKGWLCSPSAFPPLASGRVYQAQTHGSCDSPFGEVCFGMVLVRLHFMLWMIFLADHVALCTNVHNVSPVRWTIKLCQSGYPLSFLICLVGSQCSDAWLTVGPCTLRGELGEILHSFIPLGNINSCPNWSYISIALLKKKKREREKEKIKPIPPLYIHKKNSVHVPTVTFIWHSKEWHQDFVAKPLYSCFVVFVLQSFKMVILKLF